MDKKVLALLLILIVGASLTMGCAGKKSEVGATPTIAPTVASPAASTAPTVQATAAPGLPTIVPTAVPATGSSGGLSLDPSMVDISGEGQYEGGLPENGLPTPTLD